MAEATDAQIRAEKLVNELWSDGEIGQRLQAEAKKRFADIRTAEDMVGPALAPILKQNESLAAELKKIQDEREAERKAADERKADSEKKSFEEAISAARTRFNLTDEGFDKMVERMKATGNYTDPEAAAAYVASQNPPKPVAGPTFGPKDLNLFGSKKSDENMRQLHTDPQGYMDSQLNEFMVDPDKYVRETFAA